MTKITLTFSWFTIIKTLALIYLLASYPTHFYAMKNEVGFWDNNPTTVTKWYCNNTQKWKMYEGPGMGERTAGLIFSPVILPMTTIHELAQQTALESN